MFMHPPPPPPHKPIPVTVWVHGTRPSSFLPQLKRDVKQSLDAVTHAPVGLHNAQSLETSLKHYKITKALADADATQFPFEHFYVFGWSGDLDQTARQGAAFDLYTELIGLVQTYKNYYGQAPNLTLISHSHGGNVALEMTRFYKEDESLLINRFIAMACPVQKATARYTSHAMFKKIYALHSHLDMVQILDPQRLHPLKRAFQRLVDEKTIDGFKDVYQQMIENPLLSERHFPLRPHIIHVNLAWSEHVIPWQEEDIQVYSEAGHIMRKITSPLRKYHTGVLHTEFVIPSFVKSLPRLLTTIDQKAQLHIPTLDHPDIAIQI